LPVSKARSASACRERSTHVTLESHHSDGCARHLCMK
jgi:hypothetical protein